MKQISNSFMLTAAVNGKTLMARIELAPNSKGFIQSIARGSGELSPSWEGGEGPKFRAVVKDTTGDEYIPRNLQLIWNGETIVFDGNGLSTSDSLFGAGTFKRETGQNNVTWFTVCEDVFDASGNADSDSVQIRGLVDLPGGHSQEFYTNEQVVSLVEVSGGGEAYHVEMSATDISNGAATATVTAQLINLATGLPVNGVTPTWYNMNGTAAATQLASGTDGYAIANGGNGKSVLTVPEPQVNGDELFAAKFHVGDRDYWGYANVHDFNDPYFAAYEITGSVVGTQVQQDGVATVRPFIADASGTEQTIPSLTPALVLKKADGTAVTIVAQGQNGSNGNGVVVQRTVNGNKVYDISYENLVSFGNYVTGYISLEANI